MSIDELNAVLRGWQACVAFGQMDKAMTYEADQFIRENIYYSAHISEPQKESTLVELLQNRRSATPSVLDHPVYVVTPGVNGVAAKSSPAWTWIQVWIMPIDPESGEQVGSPTEAVFIVEDGQLRIRTLDEVVYP